jgi:hypothetical protein
LAREVIQIHAGWLLPAAEAKTNGPAVPSLTASRSDGNNARCQQA